MTCNERKKKNTRLLKDSKFSLLTSEKERIIFQKKKKARYKIGSHEREMKFFFCVAIFTLYALRVKWTAISIFIFQGDLLKKKIFIKKLNGLVFEINFIYIVK